MSAITSKGKNKNVEMPDPATRKVAGMMFQTMQLQLAVHMQAQKKMLIDILSCIRQLKQVQRSGATQHAMI